jgi:hypothetical protein
MQQKRILLKKSTVEKNIKPTPKPYQLHGRIMLNNKA